MSLGMQFPMDSWNDKMNRASGKSREVRFQNEDLDAIYTNLKSFTSNQQKRGRFVNAQAIKARYKGVDHNSETLLGLCEYHYHKPVQVGLRDFRELRHHQKLFKEILVKKI